MIEPEKLFEQIDRLGDTLTEAEQGDEFAQLLMILTGTTVEDVEGPMFVHNPATMYEARRTVLRWLGDRGYRRV